LALNGGAASAPEESAPTMTVLEALVENTPLAPLAGALNVTGIPATALVTGQPSLFASATCKLLANAVPTIAVCGVPATSVSWFGGFDAGHVVPPEPEPDSELEGEPEPDEPSEPLSPAACNGAPANAASMATAPTLTSTEARSHPAGPRTTRSP
jgi:hypothetical protein